MAVPFHLVALGLAPGMFWLWFLLRKDRIEPEPRHLVLRVFGLGALAAFAVMTFRPRLDGLLIGVDPAALPWLDAFVVTAATEESLKLAALGLGVLWHHEVDEPMDGIVYGGATGLGFATVENVVYVLAVEEPSLALFRGFTATLGHLAFTGSMGFLLGMARLRRRRGRVAAGFLGVLGLLVAILFHGAYDLAVLSGGRLGLFGLVVVLPAALVMLAAKMRWSERQARSAFFGVPARGL